MDHDAALEKKLAKAREIISKENAREFFKQMPTARRDWVKMKEYTQKFSENASERQSYYRKIQDYEAKGLFPEEIISRESDPSAERPRTFADDWELWIINQKALKDSMNTNVSQDAAMSLNSVGGDFRRDLWHPNIFIRGIRGGKTGICKGDPGSGKTDFVLQEIVLPISKISNIQVVTNIAMVSFNGGPIPGNIKYAATIPDALKLIIEHSLAGIAYLEEVENDPDELERRQGIVERFPFLSVWVVDEAGISKDKHDAMSNEWKTQRHITMISRKIKAFQVTIYQFDDAPDDIERLASHRYRKPGTDHQHLTEFSIEGICRETTLSGILGWEARAECGMEYIEYDTDDTAGMSTDNFDTQDMLTFTNAIAKDGAIGSKAQFTRMLEFIEMMNHRNLQLHTKEGDFFFLYKIKKSCEAEAEMLKREAARIGGNRGERMLEEAKVLMMYTRWPFLCRMARAAYPERNFYPETLRREFKALIEKYPEIEEMTFLPRVELPDIPAPVTVAEEQAT